MRAMSQQMAPPMSRQEQMLARLHAAFAPQALQLIDESARHAGHAGARPEGETHFRLLMVSARFTGLSRVARSRLVHEALAPSFAQGLHALAMTLHSPEENHTNVPGATST